MNHKKSIESITELYELTLKLFEHDLHYEFNDAVELIPKIHELLDEYVESLKQ